MGPTSFQGTAIKIVKYICPRKLWGHKNWVHNNFELKNLLGPNTFSTRYVFRFSGHKSFWLRKARFQNIFWSKKSLVKISSASYSGGTNFSRTNVVWPAENLLSVEIVLFCEWWIMY